jgi:hypothetical protein
MVFALAYPIQPGSRGAFDELRSALKFRSERLPWGDAPLSSRGVVWRAHPAVAALREAAAAAASGAVAHPSPPPPLGAAT